MPLLKRYHLAIRPFRRVANGTHTALAEAKALGEPFPVLERSITLKLRRHAFEHPPLKGRELRSNPVIDPCSTPLAGDEAGAPPDGQLAGHLGLGGGERGGQLLN